MANRKPSPHALMLKPKDDPNSKLAQLKTPIYTAEMYVFELLYPKHARPHNPLTLKTPDKIQCT